VSLKFMPEAKENRTNNSIAPLMINKNIP